MPQFGCMSSVNNGVDVINAVLFAAPSTPPVMPLPFSQDEI